MFVRNKFPSDRKSVITLTILKSLKIHFHPSFFVLSTIFISGCLISFDIIKKTKRCPVTSKVKNVWMWHCFSFEDANFHSNYFSKYFYFLAFPCKVAKEYLQIFSLNFFHLLLLIASSIFLFFGVDTKLKTFDFFSFVTK